MTSQTATTLQTYTNKPRVFILSDISNEPDDAESFVRYLTYANQFVTEGLVPVTSVWLRDRTCPDDMHTILDVYAGSLNNLNAHTHPNFPYPRVEELRGLIRPGASVYGMEAAASLRSKIRVYAISDQDDTSAWIRAEFPDIFYISSIHAWNQYGLATWVGISGETHYSFDEGGPDSSKVSKQWVKDHIQIGPLGSVYPNPEFVFEGDTPSFLYLVQNGLGSREHPNFGSWGGRYSKTDPSDRVRHYGDTADRVQGLDGRMYKSNQATIWRWRDAYQSDFAARIQWSMTDNFDKANHHPVASINGHDGLVPLTIDAEAGSTLRLDASASFDPDGDNLSFRWLQYEEPSIEVWSAHKFTANLSIELLDREGKVVEVQIPPAEKCCVEFKTWKPLARGQILHLLLEVKDDGSPQLTTYKRVLIQTTNADVKL
ncbi:cellulose-binding protein [Seiridium cupressi]